MGEKATCPGCAEHSSRVLSRFREDLACENCGLTAATALEIWKVRTRIAEAELRERLIQALVRADRAEESARRATALLNALVDGARRAAEAMEDPRPWEREW